MKTCRKCHEEKPHEEFRRNKRVKDGLSSWCSSCHRRAIKESWEGRPEAKRAARRQGKLNYKYKITPAEYDAMLERQGGVCAICSAPPGARRLGVDHCHDTLLVRGILCHNCNVGLGMFKDDPDLLAKAGAYLSKR